MFTKSRPMYALVLIAANYFCSCLGMVVVHLEKGGKEISPIASPPKYKVAQSTVTVHHNTSTGSVVQVLYMLPSLTKENREIGDPESFKPDSAWLVEDKTQREELENEILFVRHFSTEEEDAENEQWTASLSGNDLEVLVSGAGIPNGSVSVPAKLATSGDDKFLVLINKDMRARGLHVQNKSWKYKFGNIVLKKSCSYYGIPLKNPKNLSKI